MYFSDKELERYSRHILLPQLGALGQDRLRRARVLVIGAGGLGAPLMQQLAAAGVGHLGVIDSDRVSLSNLQRQVLYHTHDQGRLKVEVVKERVAHINPHIEVSAWACHADAAMLKDIMPPYDVICDGTDDAATRLIISDQSVALGKILVSGSVQGMSGQLAVFRPYAGGPCYRCLYPNAAEAPSLGCAQAGVLGPVTSIMAGFMAVDVIREVALAPSDDPAVTRLMLWDALTMTQRFIPVPRDPHCCAKHPSL